MRQSIDKRIPRYSDLIEPTFTVLQNLGGSGNNEDILNGLISHLGLSSDIVDIPHKGSSSLTELSYQAAWARTYLRLYGVIQNSSRCIWAITPEYAKETCVDAKTIVSSVANTSKAQRNSRKIASAQSPASPVHPLPVESDIEEPQEIQPWRKQLSHILQNMDPYGFERLAQRILRESGFSHVVVTKKSGDGGIDGTGKLKINGIFSFNVAFQCKRYSGLVGASFIRDFRGSLTTDIEKGVLITTGTFLKAAKEEASNPGKRQIDLIDGEELIDKIAEYGIGVHEIKTYEVDEDFFQNI